MHYKHFIDLYEIDSKQPTRLCYQLTNSHMYLTNTQKMRVKLAVQVKFTKKCTDTEIKIFSSCRFFHEKSQMG